MAIKKGARGWKRNKYEKEIKNEAKEERKKEEPEIY